jgi:hypothetical protein
MPKNEMSDADRLLAFAAELMGVIDRHCTRVDPSTGALHPVGYGFEALNALAVCVAGVTRDAPDAILDDFAQLARYMRADALRLRREMAQ